jgi:DNA-binding winged helix-turn-helix (wHTH) protein/TolB-like protein/Tfp pilus assembly protein PilF
VRYRFDQFELDREGRSLRRDGEQIALSAKAFELLCELIAHRGDVVTKDQLLERVWPNQFVEENNLSVQISALRKVLGGDGRMIATIPGRGYSFVGDVSIIEDALDETIVEQRVIERIVVEDDGRSRQLSVASRRRWPIYAGFAVVALALLGFFAYRYINSPTKKIQSVAVLPFVNATSDASNDYLSDGIAENVTYSLSQMPDVRVMSRDSAFRYKGNAADAKMVGIELNVQAILTGRVSQRGDDMNISAELVSTADNSVLWGQQFSRKLADVGKLQSDIAGSIASSLRFKLTGARPKMTDNAEAYKTYLQALYHWNKRTPDDIVKSIELFKSATEKDPQFSRAYAGLALAYEVQDSNGAFSNAEARKISDLAKAAADKALEMDENLAEAHAVLGMRRFQDWDFAGSETSFKRAIEINPNFATAHQWYAEVLSALGRIDESLAEVEHSYELDPFSRAVLMNVGLRYLAARRTDEAISVFRRLIETEPDYPMAHLMLGTAYEEKGMFLEALDPQCKADVILKIDTQQECDKESDEFREAYRRDGSAGYWRVGLKSMQRLATKGIVDDTWAAGAYIRVDDKDKAFELLEKAYAEHSPDLVYIKVEAPFRDLAGDPRYEDLLRRIGLTKDEK